MEQNQDSLKKRLNYCINHIGVKMKFICRYTGIDVPTLSRFKNGHAFLNNDDATRLKNYFDKFFMIEM